jgi:microcystin-dependent protein
MKISAETITVIANEEEPDLLLLMAGHRLTLSLDEACALVDALRLAIAQKKGHIIDIHGAATNVPGASGSADAVSTAGGSAPSENASIIAKVTEQLVSWSQIATAINSRK